jgi:integrase
MSSLPRPRRAAEGPVGPITVGYLIKMYLKLGTEEMSRRALDNVLWAMDLFGEEFGQWKASQVRTIDVRAWMAEREHLKSPATRRRLLSAVKRLWNWSIENELTDRNPAEKLKILGANVRRRPMTDAEFRALLLVSDPSVRRFLLFLRFTGARPGEAASMRWADVRLDDCCVVLERHKTAAKTGRPRVIPLVPQLVRMLVWLKTHRQVSVCGLVEQCCLSHGGKVSGRKLNRFMEHYGVSVHAVQRAREALRLVREYTEGESKGKARVIQNGKSWHTRWVDRSDRQRARSFGPGLDGQKLAYQEKARLDATAGGWVWALPKDHVQLADPDLHDFVFVNDRDNPWGKNALSLKVRRLRTRAGLPPSCKLYGLRHAFATRGIKNRASIKLVATALGHTTTAMVDRCYIDTSALGDDVKDAVLQINFGPSAVLAGREELKPKLITAVTAPPATQLPAIAEYLPAQHGCRPRHQVPPRPLPPALIPKKLLPAVESAWKAYQWAIGDDLELAAATDRIIFRRLRSRSKCPYRIPKSFNTFARYIGEARLFFDRRKRVLRERQPAPEPPAEA